MLTINDLPELVLLEILKHTVGKVFEVEDIAVNLPYLSICQRWRYIATSLVHKDLIIKYGPTEEEDDNDGTVYTFSSNIPLLINGNCNAMVKRLHVSWLAESFTKELDILMNALAMGKVLWPKDISSHLVWNILDYPKGYNPQKLGNEMNEKMSTIVDNFCASFPNVKEIIFFISNSCGVASQFISKLVGVYSNQLTKLMNHTNVPLDLPCFPPNLKYLLYVYQPMTFLAIPKLNTFPLKVLRLKMVPKDFSWNKACNSLVFPNLKKLSMYNLTGNYQSEREELAHNLGIGLDLPDSQHEPLEFPMIRTLKLFPKDTQITRFNFKTASQNLCELSLLCNLESLEHVSTLSIDSVDFVNIMFDGEVGDVNKFYKATNKLFGKSVINDNKIWFQVFSNGLNVDFSKTNWKNITFMQLESLDSTSLINAIAAMPQLKDLSVNYWRYVDEDVDWRKLANASVGMLSINNIQHEGQEEKPANYFMRLFISLECLQEGNVPETLYDVLVPKLEEAKKEYWHLKTLEIDWV